VPLSTIAPSCKTRMRFRVPYTAQPVSDDDACARQISEAAVNELLGENIQVARSLIEAEGQMDHGPRARASDKRCRWPPDRLLPPSASKLS